jgi:putative membrane protein
MKVQLIVITALMLTASCQSSSSDKNKSDSMANAGTDTTKNASASSPSNTPSDDSSFMIKAADGGALEVALGHLAESKGRDTAVKHFGREMVHDHGAMGEHLKQLASSKQITIPGTLSDESKDKVQKMQQLQGADFDKAYIDAMVKAHQHDLDAFNKEVAQGSDTSITSFFKQYIPMVQMHLQMAQSIQSTLK